MTPDERKDLLTLARAVAECVEIDYNGPGGTGNCYYCGARWAKTVPIKHRDNCPVPLAQRVIAESEK